MRDRELSAAIQSGSMVVRRDAQGVSNLDGAASPCARAVASSLAWSLRDLCRRCELQVGLINFSARRAEIAAVIARRLVETCRRKRSGRNCLSATVGDDYVPGGLQLRATSPASCQCAFPFGLVKRM